MSPTSPIVPHDRSNLRFQIVLGVGYGYQPFPGRLFGHEYD